MSTALVTGATAGIGHAFARTLARRGYDLVLVARDSDRLVATGDELRRQHRVDVDVLAADLGDRAQLALAEQRLADPEHPVDLLVNNAGFGLNRPFLASDVADEQQLLDVLVTAVMRLTHAVLPGMVERGRGGVVNVSSVASFFPFGTYNAAKSYVTLFSQGLARELDGSGVHVMALCPGYVHTEFHARARINVRAGERWWLSSNEVVDAALRDLDRGKPVCVPGVQYKAIAGATHLLPRSALPRLDRFRRNERRR
jgi:uncharacterized protein